MKQNARRVRNLVFVIRSLNWLVLSISGLNASRSHFNSFASCHKSCLAGWIFASSRFSLWMARALIPLFLAVITYILGDIEPWSILHISQVYFADYTHLIVHEHSGWNYGNANMWLAADNAGQNQGMDQDRFTAPCLHSQENISPIVKMASIWHLPISCWCVAQSSCDHLLHPWNWAFRI